MVSRAERKDLEGISDGQKPFVINLKKPQKFNPQEFDTFAREYKDRWNPNGEIVLCWVATERRIFVFPKEISHARAYQILEQVNGQTVQSAGYITLRNKWDGTFWRYLHGGAESLRLVLPKDQVEFIRNKIQIGELRDYFIPYPPPENHRRRPG